MGKGNLEIKQGGGLYILEVKSEWIKLELKFKLQIETEFQVINEFVTLFWICSLSECVVLWRSCAWWLCNSIQRGPSQGSRSNEGISLRQRERDDVHMLSYFRAVRLFKSGVTICYTQPAAACSPEWLRARPRCVTSSNSSLQVKLRDIFLPARISKDVPKNYKSLLMNQCCFLFGLTDQWGVLCISLKRLAMKFNDAVYVIIGLVITTLHCPFKLFKRGSWDDVCSVSRVTLIGPFILHCQGWKG